jgi:hypothetical protein
MSNNTISRYGARWAAGTSDLEIEFGCIRKGGKWTGKSGGECGMGLFHHYKEAQKLLWPDDDHHRWSDLGLQRIVENDITVFMGSSDSNKTYLISRFVLTDWWCFSNNTLWMVSSTELRGAELRVWGKLKELFNRARNNHPDLPGVCLESKHAITTDEISDDGSEARTLGKGIIFIPCKSGNSWVGLGAYAGIKPTKNGRLGHAGDEVSFMNSSFLDAYTNWYGKENFRGLLTGNPTDLADPLCTAGEPVDGWDSWVDTEKTQEWRSKFYNAWVVAFDGRDSPNFDYPEDQKPRYPYMIGPKKLKAVAATEGKDSPLWWMQCVGKPRPGAESLKVITKKLCEQHGAFDDVIWQGTKNTTIVALDAAYSGVGGDRCALTRIEFGKDLDGKMVIKVHPVVIVPVSVRSLELPDKQISRFVMDYCEGIAVPPSNFFFDGRSSLAVALAQTWSSQVNVVDFGGQPTARPVSQDEFIWDEKIKQRRLKRCDEHYSKFVTELWFSARYAIVSGQIRTLPQDVALEGSKRLWRYVKGSKIEVETKAEMKERTNQSPDLFDSLVIAIEGARRKGFTISKLSSEEPASSSENPLTQLARQSAEMLRSKDLVRV